MASSSSRRSTPPAAWGVTLTMGPRPRPIILPTLSAVGIRSPNSGPRAVRRPRVRNQGYVPGRGHSVRRYPGSTLTAGRAARRQNGAMHPRRREPSPFGPPGRWRHSDLIAMSADFGPRLVVSAYEHGVFPMPTGGAMGWYSPLRRGILPLDG